MKAERWRIKQLKDKKTQVLAEYIQNKYKISWDKAVEMMIRTKTYNCLIDECTGLVFESDPYIFNQLELELQGNFEEWIRL